MIPPLSGPVTRVERAGLVLALLVCVALMWPLRGYLTDDTFIHLQYARHVARGQGLVFNPGERVYGCTSPLWVALIADGMALGCDGLATARALGFAATLASVVLFLQLLRRTVRTPELRALGTVVWATHAWMLRWSLSGMETPLAVALTLAGFVAFTEGKQWGSRPLRTGALWALAALTRPEAVFLLMLWGVCLVVDTENRQGIRRLAAGSAPPVLIYGGWLLFARFYFGTFWPQTLSAKAAGGVGSVFLLDNLWRQARIVGATDGALVLVLALTLLAGWRPVWQRGWMAQRLLPWVWVVALPALYVARGVMVLSRYLLPLLPVLGWLAWHAVDGVWFGPDPTPVRRRRAVRLAILLAAVAVAQNLAVYRLSVVPQVRSFTRGFESSLVRWGRWFAHYAPRGATVATPDIGALGYYSERRVLDLAGLVTPRMVPYLERETPEQVVAGFRFASIARPAFLVDRAAEPYALLGRSPYAACLVPLGTAAVPNLGIARPGPAVYSFYRVDWAAFDSLRAVR